MRVSHIVLFDVKTFSTSYENSDRLHF